MREHTRPPRETTGRWHWLPIAACSTGIAALPYLLGLALSSADQRFTGLVVLPEDTNSYLAKMLVGAGGDWLFRLTYSPDAHSPAPLFTFFVALGHLAALTRLPEIVVFHAARIAAGLLLLAGAWRAYRTMLPSADRMTAFWIFAFGSGLGWLALPFGLITPDLIVPEFTAFTSLLANPHFPLATALEALGFASLALALLGGSRQSAAMAGLCFGLLAMLQPFLLLVVGAVTMSWIAVRLLARQDTLRRDLLQAGIAGILAAAALAPIGLTAYLDPFWRIWMEQYRAISPSPPPFDYAIALGVPGVLALLGGWRWLVGDSARLAVVAGAAKPALIRVATTPLGLLLVWVSVNLVLLYQPFGYQRRLTEGLAFPVAALAALGWGWLVPRLPRLLQPLERWLLTAAIVPSHVVLMLLLLAGVGARPAPTFVPASVLDALAVLRSEPAGPGVVLAGRAMGNLVPAWTGKPVVYGHRVESIRAGERAASVEHFFSPAAVLASRAALIRDLDVRYVVLSPLDTAPPGPFDPGVPGRVIFDRDGVTVIRIAG